MQTKEKSEDGCSQNDTDLVEKCPFDKENPCRVYGNQEENCLDSESCQNVDNQKKLPRHTEISPNNPKDDKNGFAEEKVFGNEIGS